MSGEGDGAYELAVPFIACRSQGGHYDDQSFAAGFDLGQLDRQMQFGGMVAIIAQVRGPSFRLLDLLAMHRGWVLTMLTGPGVDPGDEEWLEIELTRSMPSPESPSTSGGEGFAERLGASLGGRIDDNGHWECADCDASGYEQRGASLAFGFDLYRHRQKAHRA